MAILCPSNEGGCAPSGDSAAYLNVFFIELFCTCIFVLVNLVVKTSKTSPTKEGTLACLAVALNLMAMIFVAGNIDGAAINPAVAVAQPAFQSSQFRNNVGLFPVNKDDQLENYSWAYVLGTVSGAFLAAGLWSLNKMAVDVGIKNAKIIAEQEEGAINSNSADAESKLLPDSHQE